MRSLCSLRRLPSEYRGVASQILSGRGGQAFINELLHPVALRLTGDDISLRIDVEAVQMDKLARLAPGPADLADFFERLAIQNRDALVRAVRNVDETLVRIGRQRNAECGACPLRFTLDESFLQEFALEGKGLDAIVRTIRYIHDAIFGDLNTVRRVELLRSRTRCLARLGGLVIRLVAVGTPMALVGTGVAVEYDDAAVAVTIGNKHLVGLIVDGDARRPAQMRCIVAVDAYAASADLQQKLSLLAEFEDLAVAVPIAGEPDIVLRINGDAVLAAARTTIAIQAPLGRARLTLREGRM